MTGRIGIDEIEPVVSCGQYPGKAVVGEVVPVAATVWREGHDAVAASVVVTGPDGISSTVRMTESAQPDRFHAVFRPDRTGYWSLRIEGWSDPASTWRDAVRKKLAAGQGTTELANDMELGARLLDRAATELEGPARDTLTAAAHALRAEDRSLVERTSPALHPEVTALLTDRPVRELVTKSRTFRVWVDRNRALFGSWYELFPRSTGGWDTEGRPVHGTFLTAAEDLTRIAEMGFDVVYLPPIHPVGTVNRKGRNNTLTPEPDDVGSPWAIGSAAGGHDAVDPALGTLEDFDEFNRRARELGMEIALDLAFQAAPDHPWAAEHPEWFTVLPDGSIAYAENPPKKYQDIYPINFDTDRTGIYRELLRVTMFWVRRGVEIFRVDNPHTKPPDFWHWLITEVKRVNPDVLFLAEAFTRPARMYGLAKAGFTQSYTYFTWRTAKWELEEFGREHAANADLCRPNLWVNTPDILHESLQHGGPGMFAIRATLAGTLSPSWGMYSGYELYEHVPVRAGSEEYLDSEKYELRPRDYKQAQSRGESLEPWIARLNQIRRRHPALQQLRNLHFHHSDNDALIAYSKYDASTGDLVLIVVNLNPFGSESGTVRLDLPAIGRDWHERFEVHDEVSGEVYQWGADNFVRLEPWRNVAHILALPRMDRQRCLELSYREP
ncbi:alpha-1,4-glucan--maltose-1-phosphate maltosyltransferase [Tsukamurella serpentis]